MQTYDLGDLERWKSVPKGGIDFPRAEPRKVRLEVMCAGDQALYAEFGKKRHLLGVFEGYGVVSFFVTGPYRLVADGDVRVFTPELETLAVELPDAVTFTRIVERRQRNPELELMMSKMTANLERRISQVQRDANLRNAEDAREAVRKALEEEREKRAEEERQSIERSQKAVAKAAAAAAG